MRFRDVGVGQWFRMDLGGLRRLLFRKTSERTATTRRLSRPGDVVVSIDPELNQDSVFLTDEQPGF